MRVAILGAGMAGLLCAKALQEEGIDYTLIDKNPDLGASRNQGLHYLHDRCGLDLEPKIVRNYLLGCDDKRLPHVQYSDKLGTPLNNSLVDLPAYVVVYDFHEAFDMLVHQVGGNIIELDVGGGNWEHLRDGYDKIISTVPLPIIYPQAVCDYTTVQVVAGSPDNLPNLPGDNQVVYNIDENTNWYRYSKVFGAEWTEVKTGGDFTIKKVVDTEFVSPDEDVILLGRWGSWDRKFLAHHAYYETKRRINLW